MKTPLTSILLPFLFLSFFQSSMPGGAGAPEDTDDFCAQSELHRWKMQEDETYRRASLRMEEQLYTLAQQPDTKRGPLTQYTLPVVVHIIHDGGGENISDALVADAIQHLNDAFANAGYYNPATGVDTEIAFCLARRDPQGGATTGVNRVQSALTGLNNSTGDQAMKNLSRWDPTQYINVWVVREICSNNGCGVAGYAYLPGAHGQPYDGIVLEAGYMGSSPAFSTVLVHEMGHYLGLYHTFEGGCPNSDCRQQGDRICDTPPDNTTARTPCPTDMNSCSTDEDDTSPNNPFRPVAQGGLGDQPDMKENYMDYSRLECYDRFSQGQKDRMLSVVENIRSSLLNSPACIDPCPTPITAAFSSSALSVPLGSTVNFTNTSTNADSYEWAVDGTPFSTAVDASYTFNAEGNFQVTLTAFSNLSNCLPTDSTITIEVFCPVEAGFTASDISVLAGASVTFTNTSTNATSYTWLVNGTVVSTTPDFTLNTTEPGLYNVCLRATGPLCESLECSFVEATAPNPGCGNAFFYEIGDRAIPETAECLIPAADGGFYLGGSRGGRSLLLKLDGSGNMVWRKEFSLSAVLNSAEQVFTLLEDGQHLVGSVLRSDGSQYCFKYDLNAENFTWIRSITYQEINRTDQIISIPGSPNYIIIGYTAITGNPGCDVTWGELDKNTGNVVQLRKYHLGSCESGQDAVLVNDKVYVTGRYNAAGGGTFAMRPAITEFELDGTDNWTRLYLVNTNATARLYSNSILEDNGSLVVCGSGDLAGTSATSVVGHIYKTGIDGAIEWATAIDVAGGDTERFASILDQGDGYLAIGFYTPFTGGGENLWLAKVDKNGNLMWTKELDNGVQETTTHRGAFARDGYAYISATTSNDADANILLFRVGPSGELDTECGSLEDLQVESWQLNNPFDGFFTLTDSPFNPANSARQINPEDVIVPVGRSCSIPCEEICDNGMDDDGDGLADCDDGDCPCFEDCGNTFVKTIGNPNTIDGATAIVSAGDGAFYIGGYLDEEAMIARVTAEGEILWVRRFDFTDRPDHIINLYRDSDGFLVGASFGDDGTGAFGRGATVFRYDPENDQLLWVNYFNDRGTPDQVITNPANGNFFFIGGDILTTGAGNADNASLAELDRNTGAVVWRKEFDRGSSDRFFSMVPVGNALYCLGRYTFSSNFEKMRVTLAAFTGNGNLEWSKYYLINSTQNARMYGTSLKLDAGDLVASFYGDPNGPDLNGSSTTGIMKTDLAGGLQWARTYQLTGYPSLQAAFQLVVVPDGYLLYGYAISGDRDLVTIKTDKQGNALWAKAYGGLADDDLYYPFCKPPILQSGGNIYFVGRTRSGGSEDALLVKALADGSLNSSDCDFVREVAVTTNDWTNLFEADAGLQEQPNPNINPQLRSVQAVAASAESNILCQASPVDAIVAIDSAYCNGDSLAVALRICNEGTDTLFAALPYTFYDGNPTADPGATVLAGGFTTPGPILPGECYSTTVPVPYPQGQQVYCIANDNGTLMPVFSLETGFPPTEIIECDYINNIDSARYETTVPDIDLGPDTSVCENGVFLLDAGPGFASYRWQDGAIGQTYTTFETGAFWVEATTACGDVVSDTINILLDTVIAIALRPDTSICPGNPVTLSTPQNPAYTYQWAPAATLDCPDCPAVTAFPDSTTTYNLVVSNNTGCVSVDSVTITVEDCGSVLDTALCLGDSVLIEGRIFYPNEMDTLQLQDGSTLIVTVSALDTFYQALNLEACAGEPLEYNGAMLQLGQTELFSFTAANGCDSTVEVSAIQLDTFSTTLDTAICRGESLNYNGTFLQPGQSETFRFTAANGCDSTVLVNVNPLDTFFLALDLAACAGEAVEYEGVVIQPGQSELFTFTTADGCDSTIQVTALQLDTFFTTIDTAICQGENLDYNGTLLQPGQSETFLFTAANGCDSTVLVSVSRLDAYFQALELGACAGETVEYEGVIIQPGQSELFTFTTAGGCDSIVEVTALQLDTFSTTLDTAICRGESLDYNGSLLQPGQSETFRLTAANGCDSTVLVNVNPLDTFFLALDLGACAGEAVEYEGIIIQPGQSELFTFTTADGCDSTIEVTALQLDTFFTTIDTAICQGESFDYNGATLQPGQSEAFTFTASTGCDSTVLVNVTALDTVLTAIEVQTCFGEPYVFEGFELPGGSTTPVTFEGANGCDSTVLLTVVELEDNQTYETIAVCQGETGYVFGEPVNETGLYTETYTSYLGCDSTHNIAFVVQDTAVLNIEPGGLGCGSRSGSLTVEISGATPPYTILWSNGQATATIDGLAVGTYSVTVTDAFRCSSVGVQQVYDIIPRPTADPGSTPVSCFGDKDGAIAVNNPSGGTPPYEYSLDREQWQREELFSGLPPGDYILFIRDGEGCEATYPVNVGEPAPVGVRLPEDTTLRLGDSIRLAATIISGAPAIYEWMPPTGLDCKDCPAPIARPAESILYRLTARDSSGCTGTDEVFIDVNRTVRSYLPNAFSPNQDGRNDFFTVFAGPEVEQVQTLQVFSRWGEQVFKRDGFPPNQENLGWDGNFRGQPMPAGVYAFYGELLLRDGRVEMVKGEVVLVR